MNGVMSGVRLIARALKEERFGRTKVASERGTDCSPVPTHNQKPQRPLKVHGNGGTKGVHSSQR